MATREEQTRALLLVIKAIEETVKECPEGAPGGSIALAMMRFGIQPPTTQGILDGMVLMGKLRRSNHLYYTA